MTNRLTLEQFFKVDQGKPYPELIDGVVLRKPPGGTWPHSAVQTFLMFTLGEYGRQTGAGCTLPQLHCVFGDAGREHVLCPDLAYLTSATDKPSPPHLHGYQDGPPDIAIEVTMDEESASRLAFKTQLYLAFGAHAVWIADPDERALYVIRGASRARLVPGDTLADANLLPGFSLPIDDIFAAIRG